MRTVVWVLFFSCFCVSVSPLFSAPPAFVGNTIETFDNEEIPPPDTLESITLLLHTSPGVEFLGYLIAQDQGYYAEEGLPPVKIRWFEDGISGVREHRSGRVQFSTVWAPRIYHFYCHGSGVISIAQTMRHSTAGVLVRSDLRPEIRSMNDLTGFRVGIFFRGEENAVAVGRKLHISPEAIYFQQEGQVLLRRGVIDALCCNSYGVPVFQRYSRYRNVVRFYPFEEIGLGMPEDALACTKKFLFKHPEVCRKFVRATFRGWQTMLDDRDLAIQILKKYYMEKKDLFDEQIVNKQLDEWEKAIDLSPELEQNGFLSPQEFKKMRDLLVETNILTEESARRYEEFFYPVMRTGTMARIADEASSRLTEPKLDESFAFPSMPLDDKESEAAKPADEPKAEPAAKPADEPKAEPAAKPADEPKAEPAAKPADGPKAEPAAKTADEPKVEPAVKPAGELKDELKSDSSEGGAP